LPFFFIILHSRLNTEKGGETNTRTGSKDRSKRRTLEKSGKASSVTSHPSGVRKEEEEKEKEKEEIQRG
jgi:hypothetical protein